MVKKAVDRRHSMTSLQDLNDEYIRPLNLEWRLGERSKRRLMQAAALPALVIAAMLARAVLEYAYGPGGLVADESGAPEVVLRFYRAVGGLDLLTPAAVAVLFLAGLRSWSRAEGSWMLLTGGLLAATAIVLGVLITLLASATTDFDLLYELRVFSLWPDIVDTFGLLAVGFFFVAYRGLSSPTGIATQPTAPPEPWHT
jgi:hypothetical protein